MEDMDAFERQLATAMQQGGRPSLPVDATAIANRAVTSNATGRWSAITRPLRGGTTTPPEGGITMFSALKFVAAAVIVALFGGFLLAGVLTAPQGDELAAAAVTASPSPMTTEELLSGMVTEEVEPGVFRVLEDGVRDLASVDALDIVAGYDDGIWLLQDDGFLRLSSGESHEWPKGAWPEGRVLEVTPDGTMWVIPRRWELHSDARRGTGLRSTDGEEWTAQQCPTFCKGVTVAPDGTVWASWRDEFGRWQVGHLSPTGWQPLDGYIRDNGSAVGLDRLFVTDAGDIYGVRKVWANSLHHYKDSSWWLVSNSLWLVDVGPDGTVWRDDEVSGAGLVRSGGGERAEWTSADLPAIRYGFGLDYQFEVAPDGSLWFSLWPSADGTDLGAGESWRPGEHTDAVEDGRLVCGGLARFDGQTLDRFMPGQCISMDIAADGSVWVLAGEDEDRGLYVITTGAMAATD